jgi:hypothetical protein
MRIEGDILTVTVERNPGGGDASKSNAVYLAGWKKIKQGTRLINRERKRGMNASPAAGTIPTTAPASSTVTVPGLLPRGGHQHNNFCP